MGEHSGEDAPVVISGWLLTCNNAAVYLGFDVFIYICQICTPPDGPIVGTYNGQVVSTVNYVLWTPKVMYGGVGSVRPGER